MKEDRDTIHLERIIESIDRIGRFVNNITNVQFLASEVLLDATLMQLINIGEMVNRLSSSFKETHADLPWHKVIGMRNQIAHGYFEIDPGEVWDTCQKDLPELRKQLTVILRG